VYLGIVGFNLLENDALRGEVNDARYHARYARKRAKPRVAVMLKWYKEERNHRRSHIVYST
jgi:hypothetical protein